VPESDGGVRHAPGRREQNCGSDPQRDEDIETLATLAADHGHDNADEHHGAEQFTAEQGGGGDRPLCRCDEIGTPEEVCADGGDKCAKKLSADVRHCDRRLGVTGDGQTDGHGRVEVPAGNGAANGDADRERECADNGDSKQGYAGVARQNVKLISRSDLRNYQQSGSEEFNEEGSSECCHGPSVASGEGVTSEGNAELRRPVGLLQSGKVSLTSSIWKYRPARVEKIMLANFLIGLREGLEASLIVGILIAFAVRSNRRHVIPVIWGGVAAAIALSAATGAFLLFGLGEAGEAFEPILSGALSVLAAGLITWMVFWMAKTARNLKSSLEGNLENSFGRNSFAVALVAFFAVAREGVETALFMWASVKASGESVAATAVVILGILVATGLGWLFYRGALSLNLRVFFQWTGAALILVAAGILAYGIHEFQEVGLLPETVIVYDASAILGHDTIIGSLLYGLFSYRPNPTVLEIAVWFAYVVPVMTTFVRGHILARRPSPAAA